MSESEFSKIKKFIQGPFHFIGIGGIGMSGLAYMLLQSGFDVQGSDLAENTMIQKLRAKGCPIAIGHKPENLGEARYVIYSSAISEDNPEFQAARRARLPVVPRATLLAELMRFYSTIAVGGTHGKTTTTSLVATLLEGCGLDPTVVNGGILNAWQSTTRLGTGEWMVVEADESDGSFTRLAPRVAVVTNIDPEHLSYHGDFEQLCQAFRNFVHSVPFYGTVVLCLDHPEVQLLSSELTSHSIVSYGFNPQATVRVENFRPDPKGALFDLRIRDEASPGLRDVFLPMLGRHNVLNATAALAVGWQLGCDLETMRGALAQFRGINRRFTFVEQVGDVKIYDDYGHHPVEIKAVLESVRQITDEQIVVVVQPHRYTRLHELFVDFTRCFDLADRLFILPVYAAGEPASAAVFSHLDLCEGVKRLGHQSAVALDDEAALGSALLRCLTRPSTLIFFGAGDVTKLAHRMPAYLKAQGL